MKLLIPVSIAVFSMSSPLALGFQSNLAPGRTITATQLNFWGRKKREADGSNPPIVVDVPTPEDVTSARPIPRGSSVNTQNVDLLIIGGGVSGLSAALTAGEAKRTPKNAEIVLVEAGPECGGRVRSDKTADGFVLDHGFAVFIEEYPAAKEILDYDALKLKPFLPGALVKTKGRTRLARVADPLRDISELLPSLFAPVGGLLDKLRVLPLIINVRFRSVEDLFEERETDTMTALIGRWEFSDDFVDKFYKPFLEGIFLAPLSEQSSRMFSFIFKMFSEGSATLPQGGIGAVSAQLAERATKAGVTIQTGVAASRVERVKGGYLVDCAKNKKRFLAKSCVIATDGKIAQRLMSNVDGFESLADLPEQPQRSVGCLYYGFQTPVPVEDPILILNGIGEEAGNAKNPVNNVCFPSVVNKGYAPEGSNLCSVTVLSDAMKLYEGREDELDKAVRTQLGKWFPSFRRDILDTWELKKIYSIPNAQPGQLRGPFPANVNGGRSVGTFREKQLPPGLFVCGDHMATATLNGAIESGVSAGKEASKAIIVARSSNEKDVDPNIKGLKSYG